MGRNLVVLVFFLAALSPLLLVSADRQAGVTGPVVDWLAVAGLAPWERVRFAASPDPYQRQFIALALVGAAVIGASMAGYCALNQPSIRRHIRALEARSGGAARPASSGLSDPTTFLLKGAGVGLFFLVGRFVMIDVMANIHHSDYVAIGARRPSKPLIEIVSPLLMYMSTLSCVFMIGVVVGHYCSTRRASAD